MLHRISIRFAIRSVATVLLLVASATASTVAEQSRVCSGVGLLLEQGHYSRHKLDEAMSRQLLRNYIDELDYEHLFFTQKDIDGFDVLYGTRLGRDVATGYTEPAVDIADLFVKRVTERVAKIKLLLGEKFDFKSDRFAEINRAHSPWPKDDAQADQLWRDRIEAELLEEKLRKNASEEPAKVVANRYDEMLRGLREQSRDDVITTFLSVLAHTFDPHSEYLTKAELEDFDNTMRLSMIGIGVVLQNDGGYARIVDLMAGGPARRDGRLKMNDRIAAIAQGKGQFVNVLGMKFDKVLEMIRGKRGTVVRLETIPAHATEPRKIVEIVRDQIQLKDEEARGELIEREAGRIGWITLPEFYGDPDAKPPKSAARDVAALLNRMKKENAGGIVIDLRDNGGGELDEAVKLTSLFIKKGPVLQEKDSEGQVHVSRVRERMIYEGPLVVLTDRLTASASEIFAAAMQDYHRAIVVGGQGTFGKGTVQTLLDLCEFIPTKAKNPPGGLQLTIEKFYRIGGGSVQLRGVEPDIKLPSLNDLPDTGERAEKNAMPYDEIQPVSFRVDVDHVLQLGQLRERSAARTASDPEFGYLREDLDAERARLLANRVSLNEETRLRELAEEKARDEKRAAERAKRSKPEETIYLLTLDNIRKPLQIPEAERTAKAPEADADETAGPVVDAVREEALKITQDLIDLARQAKTANAGREPKDSQKR